MKSLPNMKFFANYSIDGKGPWRLLDHRQVEAYPEKPYFKTILEVDKDSEDLKEFTIEAIELVNYYGPFYLDLDGSDISEVLADGVQIIETLNKKWEIDLADIKCWLSGKKGLHITVDPLVFGITDKRKFLPKIYKLLAETLCKDTGDADEIGSLDFSVYSAGRGRMWRCAGIKRSNGAYKVPILAENLYEIDESDYIRLVSEPIPEFEETEPKFSLTAATKFKEAMNRNTANRRADSKMNKVAVSKEDFTSGDIAGCIKLLVQNGDDSGSNFNQAAIGLATYIALRYTDNSYKEEIVHPFCEDTRSRTYDSYSKRVEHVESLVASAKAGKLQFYKGTVISAIGGHTCKNCFICTAKKKEEVKHEESDVDGSNIVVKDGVTYAIVNDSKRKVIDGTLIPKEDISTAEVVDLTVISTTESASIYTATTVTGETREVTVTIDAWSSTRDFTKTMNSHNITHRPYDEDLQNFRKHLVLYSKLNKVPRKVLVNTNGIMFSLVDNKKVPHYVESDGSWSKDGESNFAFSVNSKSKSAKTSRNNISTRLKDIPMLEAGNAEFEEAFSALLNMNKETTIAPLLGWAVACHYKVHLKQIRQGFPLLKISGQPSSGKTSQVSLFMHLNGITKEESGASIVIAGRQTTSFGMNWTASTSTTVPRVFDESNEKHMDNEKCSNFYSLLRSAYDCLNSAHGSKNSKTTDIEVAEQIASSPLVIISEEPITEQAVVPRSITLTLNKASELPAYQRNNYDTAYAEREQLLPMAKALINDALNISLAEIKQWLKDNKSELPKEFDSRQQTNNLYILFGLSRAKKLMTELGYIECAEKIDSLAESFKGTFKVVVDDGRITHTAIDELMMVLNTCAGSPDRKLNFKAGYSYFNQDGYLYFNLQEVAARIPMLATKLGRREFSKINIQAFVSMLEQTPYFHNRCSAPSNERIKLISINLEKLYQTKLINMDNFKEVELQ